MTILKQLAGWGTGLKRRLSHDLFLATRVKIALCLSAFVILIVASFILLIEHVKQILMIGVVESLLVSVSTGTPNPLLLQDSSQSADWATYLTILIVVFSAVLCAIIVSRLALSPIKQAFEIQRRFIGGIAHELRTPLSILRMNNELARFEATVDSPLRALVDENIADIDRVNEILNNLLLFERMSSAESLRFSVLPLSPLLADIKARLAELATQKRITVSIPENAIPPVRGNKTALEQVFFNILKNAISYTPEGGSVTISYGGEKNHAVQLSITDTGVGIPEKDLPHIFEPFYRSEKTGKLSGTGIGLAIVLEIMKLHKGTLEVESVEGKGTTFFIALPTPRPTLGDKLFTPLSRISFNFSKDT